MHCFSACDKWFLVDQLPRAAIPCRFRDPGIVLSQTAGHFRAVTDVYTSVSFAAQDINVEHVKSMVRPERFELPTFWFVARRSIQLSYGRILANS
jgi:hypothetical protein